MAECQKIGRDVRLRAVVERYELVDSSSGDGAVGQALDVLKARISLVQSGQHVEYTVRVQYEGSSWTMRKRFNEFAAMHELLRKRLPGVPELPAKSVVRQFSPEYLEGRKAALDAYLQAICKRRDALNCAEVQAFFRLPEHSPAFRQAHASEPAQTAEVHEATFGIVDFAYDPAQGVLLLGAKDCSWTSRMDTKITNIKLPWEPAAPNLPTSQMSYWRQAPGELRFEMQFTCRYSASIACVALSTLRDRGFCLCGLSDGTVGCHGIRGETGVSHVANTLPLLRHTAAVVALAVDEAEQWVISASKDKALMIYDTRRQMIQCEVQTPAPTVTMRYCQEQRRLFTGLQNGRVIVWDTSILPMQQLSSIPDGAGEGIPAAVSAIDFDAATGTLFTASADGFVLWAVKSANAGCWGRRLGGIAPVPSAATAVAWAGSSREIIAGFSNGVLTIFDLDRGDASYSVQAHRDEITTILWLDAPRRLLTASRDKVLKIWDFPSLRKAPLDEPSCSQPSVSLPPHMAPPSVSSREGEPAGNARGGAGRPAASGRPAMTFDPQDPLGRPRAAPEPPGSAYAATAVPPPPATAAPSRAAAVGAAPGTTANADSDDDLAGWDR